MTLSGSLIIPSTGWLLTLVMLNKIKMPCPFLIDNQSDYLIQICWYKFTYWMTNSADPDQLASSEPGSTLFAKAGYIQVQQDKG